jgi:menaquinone-specific isochorismate synthase
LAWIRADFGLFGWGESIRVDPGTGADRFDRALRELKANGAPAAFASFTFDENAAGSIVVVPQVMVRIDRGATTYLIGTATDLPEPVAGVPMPRGRLAGDSHDGWATKVEGALSAIRAGEVEKVVLSRRLTVELDGEIPSHVVLARLAAAEPDSHTFLVDRFVGSSPELLVSLHDGLARSISLAGSADLDDPAGLSSFQTSKMSREHTLAADSVEEALRRFSPRLMRSPISVATYGDIRHLSTIFEGVTHPGTRITELLSALHPTAAVAGTPTKPALELIGELEGHDRGRYAGPVGWLDPAGEGEFAIALRCGQLHGRSATLHAGAGIVEGSDPETEFAETRIKLRPMLTALGLS